MVLVVFLLVTQLVSSTASYLNYKYVFCVCESALSREFSDVVAACCGLL